jgi:hypothetical protein
MTTQTNNRNLMDKLNKSFAVNDINVPNSAKTESQMGANRDFIGTHYS